MSLYKSGIITTRSFSNDFPIIDMEIKPLSDGVVFARILHHNNKSGTVRFTSDNVMNIQTDDLYSRLYLLEEFRDSNGLFEFLAIQPEISETTFYRWKQSNNPINTTTVADYTNISNGEGGLVKSGNGITLIAKSNATNNLWCAIGCYGSYTQNNITGIPGFGGKIVENSLDLYVRITDIKKLERFRIYNKSIISNEFYEN